MSVQQYLKARVETVPPSWGRVLSHVPFLVRLGPAYGLHVRQISAFDALSPAEAEAWVVRRLRRIVAKAGVHVPFYRDLYAAHGINQASIDSLREFRRLPVVSKADFQAVDLRKRLFKSGIQINTGGTSGQPLNFKVERTAFAREWAHMHYLWHSRGYRKEHLKLTFRGKHFGRSSTLKYNAVHNELVVNADSPMDQVVEAAIGWEGIPIRWLHGYPSLLSEFAKALANITACEHDRFRSRLYGVLLGSEFPAPHYRQLIEDHLSTNVLSWYGHSEMGVLAGEISRGLYHALPTYGYVEAVKIQNTGQYRLVCTSFHNLSHPFVRYDTGDIVEPVSSGPHGIVFQILEGRVGDFICDRHGNRHSLTAVIFGRHHAAFADVQHVQVAQDMPGRATLLISMRDRYLSHDSLRAGFDLSGLDIEWDIRVLKEPVRSSAGKIKLKVDPGH